MKRIGLYAGSFNPFHLGHFNILHKAEKIFDEVILGVGQNPEKEKNEFLVPDELTARKTRIIFYEGLLTEVVDKLEKEGFDVTVVRGLRNSTDMQYELNQYRYLQDLKPDIKVVSIFCDKEYEHISSSAIRMLKKYGKGDEYLLKKIW
jgi:pantetheine-phosphate adenylyltransferase